MSRIVIKKDRDPKEVKKDAWICMCGLSKNQPFCDKSHKRTTDEGEDVYLYNDSERMKVQEIRLESKVCDCVQGGCSDCIHK